MKNTPRAADKYKALDTDPLFKKFWDCYPRKVGKAAARKAWYALKPDEELVEKICDAVNKYALTRQWRQSAEFIPHASTFLNAERWEDDIPAPAQGSTTVINTRDSSEAAVKSVKLIKT